MGKKLTDGTHTRTPTSPAGDSRVEEVTNNGGNTTHDGVLYAWAPTLGLYRARIPPDPHNPPGEWHFLVFNEADGYDEYTAQPFGSDIWTEKGQDVANSA